MPREQVERAAETFLPVPEPTLCGMAFRDGTVPVTAISQHNKLLEYLPAAEQRCLTPLGRLQCRGAHKLGGSKGPHYTDSQGGSQLCH